MTPSFPQINFLEKKIVRLETENKQLRFERDLLALNAGHLPDTIKVVVNGFTGEVDHIMLLPSCGSDNFAAMPGRVK